MVLARFEENPIVSAGFLRLLLLLLSVSFLELLRANFSLLSSHFFLAADLLVVDDDATLNDMLVVVVLLSIFLFPL